MKRLLTTILFALLIIFLASCAGLEKIITQPVPEYTDDINQNTFLVIDDIKETKAGAGNIELPEWLTAFFIDGIDEVEKMTPYNDKYSFVIINQGKNFGALNKWADNYSVTHDFPRMAAARIEKRLVSEELYQDAAYGIFFERLIKKSFSAEYTSALVEDTYWIKSRVNKDSDAGGIDEAEEIYEFFIFISVDKDSMQKDVFNMMTETLSAVTLKRAQKKIVNRLQQTFFEGF